MNIYRNVGIKGQPLKFFIHWYMPLLYNNCRLKEFYAPHNIIKIDPSIFYNSCHSYAEPVFFEITAPKEICLTL